MADYRRTKAANVRRYVALRGLFLRLSDDIFGLTPSGGEKAATEDSGPASPTEQLGQDPWEDALGSELDSPPPDPEDAELQRMLSENLLPDAVLALSVLELKAAVLGTLTASRVATGSVGAAADGQVERGSQTESGEEKPELLVIVHTEEEEKRGQAELVESLEPFRSSVCDLGLTQPLVGKGGSIAITSALFPGSAVFLTSEPHEAGLRVHLAAGKASPVRRDLLRDVALERRHHSAAAAVGRRIFVSGGIIDNKSRVHTTARAYSIHEAGGRPSAVYAFRKAGGKPAALPEMRKARSHHSLVGHRGRLVALGGLGCDESPLSSVEGLPLSEATPPDSSAPSAGPEWEELPPLPVALHSFGAVVFKDRIFVAGGALERAGEASSASRTVYFLGEGGWEAAGALGAGRRGVSLVVFGGRLCALGGVSGPEGEEDRSWADSVEVFREDTKTWRLLPGELRLPVQGCLALTAA